MRLSSMLLMSAAMFATAIAGHAQTLSSDGGSGFITKDSIPLTTHVGGRAMTGAFSKGSGADEVDGEAWVHKWPGLYWTAGFTGDELDLRFADTANKYTLHVDGKPVAQIERPGTIEYRMSGLGAGSHTVRLEKTTESQASTGQFDGFFVPPGETDAPPAIPARQIEFIGDSFSAGYGNTSKTRTCTQQEIWATTDTQAAWGPLTARHYDADYQVNAYSGMGMVRNYNGAAPGRTMPDIYDYDLMDDKVSPYDPAKAQWDPQIVVIALGGNDFSTQLNPGETWKTQDDLRADYVATYVTFVESLRQSHPDASFILVDYEEDKVKTAVADIIKSLNAAGETRVAPFSVTGDLAKTGCDWHLNTDDDAKISQQMISYIDAHPDLWTPAAQ